MRRSRPRPVWKYGRSSPPHANSEKDPSVDSATDRAPIAQRGHAKQKRNDLRLVGLGLVVTRDGAIPVTSHGDGGTRQVPTVVFDAGQNSAANFAHLTETGPHFVGSLPPSDFPDLLALPARRRRPVEPDRFAGLSACDTRAIVFGTDRRVVLTHSATLHAAQSRGFAQTLAKTTRALTELAATLARGKTRREPAAVQATIDAITCPRSGWPGC